MAAPLLERAVLTLSSPECYEKWAMNQGKAVVEVGQEVETKDPF